MYHTMESYNSHSTKTKRELFVTYCMHYACLMIFIPTNYLALLVGDSQVTLFSNKVEQSKTMKVTWKG